MKPFVATVLLLFLCLGCSTLTPTEKEFDEVITTYPTLKQALRKDPQKVNFINVIDYADTVFPNDDLLKFKKPQGVKGKGCLEKQF